MSSRPDTDFEQLWSANKAAILDKNEEYKRIKDSYKLASGADWLLFAIPAVVGITVFNYAFATNELLNWLLSALASVVAFVGCVWIKSLLNGNRTLSEVENEVKDECRKRYEQTGQLL
ncbi:MAG TPA: hypothetical protein VIQ97_04680 [Prevotella sp.]